jgi:hypothetical protein
MNRPSAKVITAAELCEAKRGIELILAKKFPASIAGDASDLLGQANVEYVKWLKDNAPADNPVGWLLTCARWRTLNLLDSETRKPRTTPLDAVFHLADESTPTPEQQVIEADLQKHLRKALSHLPQKSASYSRWSISSICISGRPAAGSAGKSPQPTAITPRR